VSLFWLQPEKHIKIKTPIGKIKRIFSYLAETFLFQELSFVMNRFLERNHSCSNSRSWRRGAMPIRGFRAHGYARQGKADRVQLNWFHFCNPRAFGLADFFDFVVLDCPVKTKFVADMRIILPGFRNLSKSQLKQTAA
jgi:hypothetical protein